MERTRWNDDLPTYLEERFYTKDEIDQLLERLSLQSGLLFNNSLDHDIIQSSETATIHTEVTWSNGAGLEGKDVVYEVRQGETLIDLETVQTDVDGVAEYEYTGTGIGEVTVTAKYGSLLQETYAIGDYLVYDSGVTGRDTTKWTTSGSPTISTDETGTVISATSSSIYKSNTSLTGDFEAIIYVSDILRGVRVGVTGTSNSTRSTIYNEGYVKIHREDGVVKIYHSTDGSNYTETTYDMDTMTSEDCNFFFFAYVSGGNEVSIKFKDLKIYSA